MALPTSTLADTPAPEFRTDPRAACKTADPVLFFGREKSGGGRGASYDQAKQICAGCPLQADCLAYALPITNLFGVWGGTTPEDRYRLRQERGYDSGWSR